MELRVILSEEEKALLDVDETEFSEGEAVHLLMTATGLRNRRSDKIDKLRAVEFRSEADNNRGELLHTWDELGILDGLIDGLKRVTGLSGDA